MHYTRAEVEQAEAHLVDAERRISKQRREVERLRAAGLRSVASESILASMEDLALTLRESVNLMHRSNDRS